MKKSIFREEALLAVAESAAPVKFEGHWPFAARWTVLVAVLLFLFIPVVIWLAYDPSQQVVGNWIENSGACHQAAFILPYHPRGSIAVNQRVKLRWLSTDSGEYESVDGRITEAKYENPGSSANQCITVCAEPKVGSSTALRRGQVTATFSVIRGSLIEYLQAWFTGEGLW